MAGFERFGDAWGSIRAFVGGFSFYDIKDLAGAAGLQVQRLSHLEQRSGGQYASKGQLLDGVEKLLAELQADDRDRVVTHIIKEIVRRRAPRSRDVFDSGPEPPNIREQLNDVLNRVGWEIDETGEPLPVRLRLNLQSSKLPPTLREGLGRALRRYRDGDVSGSLTSICGMVDTLTANIWTQNALGDHTNASYQERVFESLQNPRVGFQIQPKVVIRIGHRPSMEQHAASGQPGGVRPRILPTRVR